MEKALRLFLCALLTIGCSQLYANSNFGLIKMIQDNKSLDTITVHYPKPAESNTWAKAQRESRFIQVKSFKQIKVVQEGKLMFKDNKLTVHEVFPNPADAFTMVKYKATVDNAKILLKNVLGKDIKEYRLSSTGGYSQLKIPTNYLRNGVYFYTLFIGKKAMASKKLVIKH